ESNITFIFVTHDINEAVSLGDKVIIMEDGQIDQYDTPEKIVNEPATEFAKTLIGDKSIIKI
ncbi:MAG: osmoprotectant, partial [Methanobacteriaceae archaeon]|nr:osmoprotectant [Methanobacteriaceae archaeon]